MKSKVAIPWQFLGISFIALNFALLPNHLGLFAFSLLGAFFSFQAKKKGFLVSLFLLALYSSMNHAFAVENHLFVLGVECSYALSFWMMTLIGEEERSQVGSLLSILDAKNASLMNLEEALTEQSREQSTKLGFLEEKVRELQKNLDETVEETESLRLLNDVLRVTTKEKLDREEALETKVLETEIFASKTFDENKSLKEQIKKVQSEDALAFENEEFSQKIELLSEEVTTLKKEKERFSHYFEKERSLNASLEKELNSLEERNSALLSQNQIILSELSQKEEEFLQKDQVFRDLERISEENEALERALLEQKEKNNSDLYLALQEKESLKKSLFETKVKNLSELEKLQVEKSALEEALLKFKNESTLGLEAFKEKEKTLENELHEKAGHLHKLESLHKQLKMQFKDRSQELHERRKEIFNLQLSFDSREIDQREADFEISDLEKWLFKAEEKVELLERENQELEALLSYALKSDEPLVKLRKKKVKKIAEQISLF